MVAPMPSAGQTVAGAEGTPKAVAEQPATEVILLPMLEQTKMPLTLVALSVVGTAPLVKAPPTQTEVVMTVASQAQPDVATVVPEEVVPLA